MNGNAIGVGFFLIFLFFAVLFNVVSYANSDQVRFTVTDKQTKMTCDGKSSCSDKYLVYTDSGTYEITDSLILFRFNSSDVYGRLIVGKTYRADAYGWRVPFLSMYQNLDNVRAVGER